MSERGLGVRKDTLPRGFSQPLSFFSSLQIPDGAIATMQFIIDHTFGRRAVCPLTIGAIAGMRGKCRDTISLHLGFWQDLQQLRLEHPRRGDGRAVRIVLCFRERGEDVKTVADLQIQALPEKALNRWTFAEYKAERKAKRKPLRKAVKETRGEYVA